MHFTSFTISALFMALTLVTAAPSELVRRADLNGFDISQPQSSSFWSCAHSKGYNKVSIRIYQQACGSGGKIDGNFLTSYNAARSAGITNIDAYMFPCTGTQPRGVACKPIKTQINELLDYLKAHRIIVQRLWLDVEPTSGECNAWNLSKTKNLDLAKQWVAALRDTRLKWGIYANGNQWTAMFPSRSSNIGSDLPLLAVQSDSKPGVSTVRTFMGGWTKAYGKQYKLDTSIPGCGGSVDLDSFTD